MYIYIYIYITVQKLLNRYSVLSSAKIFCGLCKIRVSLYRRVYSICCIQHISFTLGVIPHNANNMKSVIYLDSNLTCMDKIWRFHQV